MWLMRLSDHATRHVARDDAHDHHFDHHDHVSETTRRSLSWLISLLFHAGLVVIALFIIWSDALVADEDEDLVVPETKFINDIPTELFVPIQQTQLEATTDIPREIETQTVTKGDPLSELTLETEADLSQIGVAGSKPLPLGAKIGDDDMGVGIFGLGGNARKIVYVIDTSGSMADLFTEVKAELKESVNRLVDEQSFTIILFQQSKAIEVDQPSRGLKAATAKHREIALNWIDNPDNAYPGGKTNPIEAIELALRYEPDLIFILSDNIRGEGQYEIDKNDLLKRIRDAKGGGKTRINTIEFGDEADKLATMETIARQHGGRFVFKRK